MGVWEIKKLELAAEQVRESIIKMLLKSGSGHTAGPLGSTDFWVALYLGGLLNCRPEDPWWPERDRVVLSAGHYAPVVYATLAKAGFFEESELLTLRSLGSRLQGHPHFEVGNKDQLPGIENTSGPLGQGVSVAVGMALAARMDNKRWRVVCFMGDGEQDEGQVWEAYMLAGREKLSNLLFVIDRNKIQLDGYTEKVMPLEPLREKLLAFNLNVVECDGNNIGEIVRAVNLAKTIGDKPSVILLRTIPGKGVHFMENQPKWHGRPPIADEAAEAIKELRSVRSLNGSISLD